MDQLKPRRFVVPSSEDTSKREERGQVARLAIIAIVASITVIDSLRWLSFVHPDWLIARAAGRTLWSSKGLEVYAAFPRAQMGPLALTLAQLPRSIYVVLTAAAIAPCIYWLSEAAVGHREDWTARSLFILSVGAALCIVPWSQLAWKGHADDALVILGLALMLKSAAGGSRRGKLLGLGIAVAGKPTALVLLPFLLTSGAEFAAGLAIVAAIWLPFLLAEPIALLRAGRGVMSVAPGSLPSYLGTSAHASPPAWIRPVQLFAGLGASAIGVLRDHAAEGLLLGFTIRALVDPNPAPAYSIPLVLVAVAVDLGHGWPITLPLAMLSFWLAQPVLNGGTGVYRIAALIALALACGALLRPSPSTDDGTGRSVTSDTFTLDAQYIHS